MKVIPVDPDGIVKVTVNWGPWLEDDTIDTPTWIDDGTGPSASAHSNDDTLAHALIDGNGAAPGLYLITSRIDTAGGQRHDQSFYVRIRDK